MLEIENFAITFRGALKPELSKKCKIFTIILIKQENSLENALWSKKLSKNRIHRDGQVPGWCVQWGGRRGNINDELKERLMTNFKVWSVDYSLDLILTIWAGKCDMFWYCFYLLGE